MKPGILLLLSCLLLCSCSNREIYNIIQAHEKNECIKLPRTQQQECRERTSISYDDYKNSTKESAVKH